MIGGFYVPGTTLLHRAEAGTKLIGLILFGTALLSLSSLPLTAVALAAILAGYALARLRWRAAWRQVRPVLFVLAALFAAQIWLAGIEEAALVVLRFAALILAAGLVTLTTRTADLVAAIETGLLPFERFGIDVEKVALAISLTIRFIPHVGQIVEEVREAQAARGADRSIVALAVPVVIRLLKTADAVAEAIDARS